MYRVSNPTTGQIVKEYAGMSDEAVEVALTRSQQGYLAWRQTSFVHRSEALNRAAQLFEDRADELAAIVTRETGKRINEARGEVTLTANIFRYYAEHLEAQLQDEHVGENQPGAVIQKLPIGPVLGVMPWNYPYYQVARFAAPNLALGNTILVKHASQCPESSSAIETLMRDAGFPEEAYINLFATSDQIATMIADERLRGASVTGSERAGIAVATQAARHIKKVVLELGGSDPMIVLDSSDVTAIATQAAESRMGNTGQSCASPKRMIVMADIYDEFVAQVCARLERYEAGDPADAATTLGPVSSIAAADQLVQQIQDAANEGAAIRLGGTRLDRSGAFVAPTVITDVRPGMNVHHEELFGPVCVIYRVETEEEAVALANDTPFGLAASVFSEDVERARRVGAQLDVGMLAINQPTRSQPHLPFGGVKRSGLGRELGALGIEEFMNKRLVQM